MVVLRGLIVFLLVAWPALAQEPSKKSLKDYVNLKDGMNLTTLHYAAAKGALETTKKLLEMGADPNAQDELGVTPLHLAALKGQTEAAKILLAGGAKINLKDNLGATPVNYAIAGAHEETEKFLRENQGKESDDELVNKHFQPGALKTVEVVFESVPEGADVFVDGTEVCRATPCRARLGLGKHQVAMRARWYLRHEAEADVQKETTIKFELKKKPHTKDVLIVMSKKFALYDKAVMGFKELFKGSTEQVVMTGTLANPKELSKRVLKTNPKVILAVGLRAAKILKMLVNDVPIVFCMAIHPVQNGLRTETSTGVHLEPSVAEQLRAVNSLISHVKKIGIIYDPNRTGRLVAEFRDEAAKLKIEIVTVPVKSQSEAFKALEEIPEMVQALWLLRDPTVLTRKLFNRALVLQYKKKMPLIAYSEQFVRKGAFISYSAGYPRQGRKAAEIVQAILQGKSISELNVANPDGAITINLMTAEKMKYIMPKVRMLKEVDLGIIVFEDIPGVDQK